MRDRPGRACSVCTHARSADITKALTAGDSVRGISSRFGVTAAAAHRHLQNCLRITRRVEKPREKSAGGMIDALSRFEKSGSQDPAKLVEMTARLVDEALDLLEHAKRADDRRTALTALREARDGLALLMRSAGMLAGDAGATTVIDQRRQVVNVLAKLTEDELRAIATGQPIPATVAEIGTSFRDQTALNVS